MNPTRLCIVRHGETDWNAARRIQGQTDIPLNAAGQAQAAATATGLAGYAFDAIYSSDLLRTWQTAQPIAAALGLGVNAAPGLRERHYGRMQGLTSAEAQQRFPALHAAYAGRDPQHDLDGGETLADFAARIARTLAALAAAHAGQTLLLVAHGGVLDIVYRIATARDLIAPRDFPIPNAGVNWIEYRDDAWHLVAWGEKTHLDLVLDEVSG
ncbi:MAG: histidine phosphatase family protein [Rhodocyclaceae bacterium]|nr:histidine phosphatase family protein [Rhodocyclaceae bacterium]